MQNVISFAAIVKSPKQMRPSLGIGMVNIGQTLRTQRLNTWLFFGNLIVLQVPFTIYIKELDYIWFMDGGPNCI